VKKLVKSIARFFGYEIRKITPRVPAGIKKFFNAPEGSLDFDVGDLARVPAGGNFVVPARKVLTLAPCSNK
jgi:hypothetical protein